MWIICAKCGKEKLLSLFIILKFCYTKKNFMSRTYKPKKKKRKRKHGFLKRMRSKSGKRVVQKRRRKKRKRTTV